MTGPTIYDVARESGVSIKTVSRVINGAPNVREQTARRVREVVKRLDYHPNPSARSLGGGKLRTIGIVVDDIGDPFFAMVVAVVEHRAMAAGMDVLVASHGMDENRMATQIQRLVRRGVSGLIVAPVGDDARSKLPDKTPVVVVDRRSNVADRDLVHAADEAGALLAVRHLVGHGHRRIAYFGMTSGFSTLQDRYTGFEKALREIGETPDSSLVETRVWTTDQANPYAYKMLSRGDAPSAVFAASPQMGLAVLRAQRQLSRQDIALVVFGDFPAADLMMPGTTVIDQHPKELAEGAFDHLLHRMESPHSDPRVTTIATHLVERGSGELRAAESA